MLSVNRHANYMSVMYALIINVTSSIVMRLLIISR